MTTQIPDSWELPSYLGGLGDIEPYDPEIHGRGPAELYSQDSLSALENHGFEPLEHGYWHRPVMNDAGDHVATHYLSYRPGRRGLGGNRLPWNLTTNPDEVGEDFSVLRGPNGAIAAANTDAAHLMKMAKQARAYLLERMSRA